MKTLHREGIQIGQFESGARDSIADVRGVRVGHVDIEVEDAQIGLSIVEPYPFSKSASHYF